MDNNYYMNDLLITDNYYQIDHGLGGTEETFLKLLTHNILKIKDKQ
jgi:hypothetical protein